MDDDTMTTGDMIRASIGVTAILSALTIIGIAIGSAHDAGLLHY